MNGIGRTYGFFVPARSDTCVYNGTPYIHQLFDSLRNRLPGVSSTFSAAPALAMPKLTPKIAFAPRLVLFVVPSSFFKNASTAD